MHLAPDDLDLVGRTPLFSGMKPTDLVALLDGASVANFPDGGLVFGQGDVADRFFLVLAGRVHLFALTETGNQTIIEVFEAGWTFAEAAIFASARYPLNAEVVPGTRLLQIPAAAFLRRLSEHRAFAFKMLANLSRWQRHLVAEIVEQKSKSPAQRLASYLLGLIAARGLAADAAAEVTLPLSKADLASRIGITPESLSRVMARLRAVGVETHGRCIAVADAAALRRFCEGGD